MKKGLKKFGKLLKDLRLQKQLSLRDVCKETGYDPSNWSKIERGMISPPLDEKVLRRWASALGLEANAQKDFIDEAVIAQGVIPEDILENKNAIKLMPAFFRTLRNEKPTKEEIDNLIRLLKNN